jgi:HEAT repeat protein
MTDDQYGKSRSMDALNARALSQKREYVQDLATRGDADAVEKLAECLCDESWFLRDLAEKAFPALGDRGAPALLPLLDAGLWFTRTSAARVLGRMGYRPAVPSLLRLCDDANTTVAEAARDALVGIGRHGGAVRLAYALHRLPPDARRARLDEIAARDRAVAERADRLGRSDELMNAPDIDALSDDSAPVRATEDGVEWEILTGPPPTHREPDGPGGANA